MYLHHIWGHSVFNFSQNWYFLVLYGFELIYPSLKKTHRGWLNWYTLAKWMSVINFNINHPLITYIYIHPTCNDNIIYTSHMHYIMYNFCFGCYEKHYYDPKIYLWRTITWLHLQILSNMCALHIKVLIKLKSI